MLPMTTLYHCRFWGMICCLTPILFGPKRSNIHKMYSFYDKRVNWIQMKSKNFTTGNCNSWKGFVKSEVDRMQLVYFWMKGKRWVFYSNWTDKCFKENIRMKWTIDCFFRMRGISHRYKNSFIGDRWKIMTSPRTRKNTSILYTIYYVMGCTQERNLYYKKLHLLLLNLTSPTQIYRKFANVM